ncbi:hypothetical protein CGRA01v4_06598 [Colletotrichum graminicola]|nr:hypothetical protein CGRA01v4_06598 [Colletotrichum graminicola]
MSLSGDKWTGLPPAVTTAMAISKHLPEDHQLQGGKPSDEIPRLRFDDFSYESRIFGPQVASRPLSPRHRTSWAFLLRRGSGFQLDISESTSSNTTSRTTISTSGGVSEPPPFGIMKTMEVQISYEARTWKSHERMADSRTLRPSTIADIRSITSGDVSLFSEEISSTSQSIKIENGHTTSCYRHSSPLGSTWEWLEDGQMRPISTNGQVQPYLNESSP